MVQPKAMQAELLTSGSRSDPTTGRAENIQIEARQLECTCVALEVSGRGYARVDPNFLETGAPSLDTAFQNFLTTCDDLPADPYCAQGSRLRRFGRFRLNSETADVRSEPPERDDAFGYLVTRYEQPAENNPEHAGRPRFFAALRADQCRSPFLRMAIARCFRGISWPDRTVPLVVGVHIVETVARQDHPGVSTPNHLHHDGEPVTWAFLLSRSNVAGGENIIAMPTAIGRSAGDLEASETLARFTLERPLEGWVVDDQRVCHYVSPIEVVGMEPVGHRTILLIDFSLGDHEGVRLSRAPAETTAQPVP
jgi:hypothetical protein